MLQPALEKMSVDVKVCPGINSGREILTHEKFDAVIVDCDDLDGGLQMIEGLRKAKNSVTFAILNGNTTTKSVPGRGELCLGKNPFPA